jgi:hypothetical protein
MGDREAIGYWLYHRHAVHHGHWFVTMLNAMLPVGPQAKDQHQF